MQAYALVMSRIALVPQAVKTGVLCPPRQLTRCDDRDKRKPARSDPDRLFDQRDRHPPVAIPIFPPEDCVLRMPEPCELHNI
jgi:hypothetical protein